MILPNINATSRKSLYKRILSTTSSFSNYISDFNKTYNNFSKPKKKNLIRNTKALLTNTNLFEEDYHLRNTVSQVKFPYKPAQIIKDNRPIKSKIKKNNCNEIEIKINSKFLKDNPLTYDSNKFSRQYEKDINDLMYQRFNNNNKPKIKSSYSNTFLNYKNFILIKNKEDLENFKFFVSKKDDEDQMRLYSAKILENIKEYEKQKEKKNLPILKISNNYYFDKIINRVVRKVVYYTNKNEKYDEDFVMNMLFEEGKNLELQTNQQMELYCKIKNFSTVVLKDDYQKTLIPLINSVRPLTEKDINNMAEEIYKTQIKNLQNNFINYNNNNMNFNRTEVNFMNHPNYNPINIFQKNQYLMKNINNDKIPNLKSSLNFDGLNGGGIWDLYNKTQNIKKEGGVIKNFGLNYNFGNKNTLNIYDDKGNIIQPPIINEQGFPINNNNFSITERNINTLNSSNLNQLNNYGSAFTNYKNAITKNVNNINNFSDYNTYNNTHTYYNTTNINSENISYSQNQNGKFIQNRNNTEESINEINININNNNTSDNNLIQKKKETKIRKHSQIESNDVLDENENLKKTKKRKRNKSNNEEFIGDSKDNKGTKSSKDNTQDSNKKNTKKKRKRKKTETKEESYEAYDPNIDYEQLEKEKKEKKELENLKKINTKKYKNENIINENIEILEEKSEEKMKTKIIKEEKKIEEINIPKENKEEDNKIDNIINNKYYKESEEEEENEEEEEEEEEIVEEIKKKNTWGLAGITKKQSIKKPILINQNNINNNFNQNEKDNDNQNNDEKNKNNNIITKDGKTIQITENVFKRTYDTSDNDIYTKFKNNIYTSKKSETNEDNKSENNNINNINNNRKIEEFVEKKPRSKFSNPHKGLFSSNLLKEINFIEEQKTKMQKKRTGMTTINLDYNDPKSKYYKEKKEREENEKKKQTIKVKLNRPRIKRIEEADLDTKVKDFQIIETIKFQMKMEMSEEGKALYQELLNQIEKLKNTDINAYINSIGDNFEPFKEEIDAIVNSRLVETRINQFMDSLNKDRDLYINNRLLLAEKCKVIDYKINTSLDERRNSQLKQKIDYENMIF